jgi:hypothetical protein
VVRAHLVIDIAHRQEYRSNAQFSFLLTIDPSLVSLTFTGSFHAAYLIRSQNQCSVSQNNFLSYPWRCTQMNISLLVFWAIIGFDCGTPWPGFWLLRLPIPPPPPEPRPRPNWLLLSIIGIVGGLAGGWVFTQVFGPSPEPWTSLVPAATTGIGAFAGGRLLVNLYGIAKGGV